MGIILVHLDWPWVFEPTDVGAQGIQACWKTLCHLERATALYKKIGHTILGVLTPNEDKQHKAPHTVQKIVDLLLDRCKETVTTSTDLEDCGADIVKQFPHIQSWKIGGFWEDLCCADIKYGILETGREAQVIPTWSHFPMFTPHMLPSQENQKEAA